MGKMIDITLRDQRKGWENMLSGRYSKLFVKFLPGAFLEDAVILLSDIDQGFSLDERGFYQIDRTTVLSIDPEKVEWACILEAYNTDPLTEQKGKKEFREIPGVPGGPKIALQRFLKDYPFWVAKNAPIAIEWLRETAIRRDLAVADLIDYAASKKEDRRRNSSWRGVATRFGLEEDEVGWKDNRVGIASAPIRIAIAIQRKHREDWNLVGENAFRFEGDYPTYPEKFEERYTVLPSLRINLKEMIGV